MEFADALTALNTKLDDADNFTFSVAQKTDFLTEAWNDEYVVADVFNTDLLTFSSGTQEYDLTDIADTFSVTGIYYEPAGDGTGFEPLPAGAYEMVTDTLLHISNTFRGLRDGATLAVKGYSKLATDEELPERIQDYVLKLAQLLALNGLMMKRLNRFLKNDTTMADILNAKNQLERDVAKYRQKFRRQYEVS